MLSTSAAPSGQQPHRRNSCGRCVLRLACAALATCCACHVPSLSKLVATGDSRRSSLCLEHRRLVALVELSCRSTPGFIGAVQYGSNTEQLRGPQMQQGMQAAGMAAISSTATQAQPVELRVSHLQQPGCGGWRSACRMAVVNFMQFLLFNRMLVGTR